MPVRLDHCPLSQACLGAYGLEERFDYRRPRKRGSLASLCFGRFRAIPGESRGTDDFPTVPRAGATPVPIPNTEVKPCFGDGTAEFPLWESSATVGSLERRRVDLSVDAAPLSFVGLSRQTRETGFREPLPANFATLASSIPVPAEEAALAGVVLRPNLRSCLSPPSGNTGRRASSAPERRPIERRLIHSARRPVRP